MSNDLNSLGTAIAFAILTSIALTSLFETISQMEDPFVGIIALDGIDIKQELAIDFMNLLLDCRQQCIPDATPMVLGDYSEQHQLLPMPNLRLLQTDAD